MVINFHLFLNDLLFREAASFCQSMRNHDFVDTETLINHLFPMHPFSTPWKQKTVRLKTENRKVFWCFQGAEKGCIENKLVNIF